MTRRCGNEAFRDRFDFAILRYAVKRRIPVLGVCRGEQVMNVCFGGSLHQHMPEGFELTRLEKLFRRIGEFGKSADE